MCDATLVFIKTQETIKQLKRVPMGAVLKQFLRQLPEV